MAKKKNHDTQQPHPPVTEQTTSPAEETTPEEVTDAAENTGAQTELEALQAEMAAQKDQFLRMHGPPAAAGAAGATCARLPSAD